MTIRYYIFGFLLFVAGYGYAQDRISAKDAYEISFKARETIQRSLPDLLNLITNTDEKKSDLIYSDIANSYDPTSRNYIFRDSIMQVADDIDPLAKLGDSKNVTIKKYLTDLTINYQSTNDNSISFTNVKPSAIKKRNYVFVRVKFDAVYKSKHTVKNTSYPIRAREALVRMDKGSDNHWIPIIVGMDFYNPANPIDTNSYNVQVTRDSTQGSEVLTQDELDRRQQAYDQQKAEEQKKKDAQFKGYMDNGNKYASQNNYKDALAMFAKAKGINSLDASLDKAILDTKRDSAEYTYDNFRNKGDLAKRNHHYEDAVKLYTKALELKPGDTVLPPVVNDIEKIMSTLSLPSNLLQSGDAPGTIKECERILELKENRASKGKFPELYYYQAKAYELMLAGNFGDSKSKDKALENYTAAIAYFPNYVEALVARAAFLIRYSSNFNGAISDYDRLTTIVSDTAAVKVSYYVQKAKWKEVQSNPGGALSDYAQAIRLSPKADSIYYDRGWMLYNILKFDDAKKSFDAALEINPHNNLALYARGLTYNKLGDNDKAGIDFADAEKAGLPHDLADSIQAISDRYCAMASDSVVKHNFDSADAAYDNALKIRNCNLTAFIGKATIRYITGQELAQKNEPDNSKKSYLASIDCSNKALKCNPNFTDGYYWRGMAQASINENDEAIGSFTSAVKANDNNTQAYLERGKVELTIRKYRSAENDYSEALVRLEKSYEQAKKDNQKDKLRGITADQAMANLLDGQAFYYLNDYTSALTALGHSLDKGDNNSEALYYRGLVYAAQQEWSKSIDDLDKAISIRSSDKYYFANGMSNFNNKNYGAAIEHFKYLLVSDSANNFKNKHYLLGMSYFKSKAFVPALVSFDEYGKSEAARTDTIFYINYGMAQLYGGKYPDAQTSFSKALALSADNARAEFGLGCYYAKVGQADKVLECMEKALSKGVLAKGEISGFEDAFLTEFNRIRANRLKYDQIKKKYGY